MILTFMRMLFLTCWHKLTASEVSLFVMWSVILMSLLLFHDDAEECMCQSPLTGSSFNEDNCTVFCRLKAFLVDTPGWVWIEPCNLTKNRHQAFVAWVNHCDGEGELSKCTQSVKAWITNSHHKNEQSMSFKWHTELLAKCFATLDEDADDHLLDHQKVEKLLKGTQSLDAELVASKAVIMQNCLDQRQ